MARGKKLYDKRQDIAKKDQRREAERDFKVKKSLIDRLVSTEKVKSMIKMRGMRNDRGTGKT